MEFWAIGEFCTSQSPIPSPGCDCVLLLLLAGQILLHTAGTGWVGAESRRGGRADELPRNCWEMRLLESKSTKNILSLPEDRSQSRCHLSSLGENTSACQGTLTLLFLPAPEQHQGHHEGVKTPNPTSYRVNNPKKKCIVPIKSFKTC